MTETIITSKKKVNKKEATPFGFTLKLEEHLAYFIANKTAQSFSPTEILEEYKKIKETINEDNIELLIDEARLRSLIYTNRAKLGYTKENILATARKLIDSIEV